MWQEVGRVVLALPVIEMSRLADGPSPLIARLRERGQRKRRRNDVARRALQRAIALVDRFTPGGANCYRRVLLEIALDSGAASEPVHLGLQKGGNARSGHAWLGERSPTTPRYDVELAL